MIDILVYIFETYGYAGACPSEPNQLARKLSAAGFEEEEISEAIGWLADLNEAAASGVPEIAQSSNAMRIYDEHEQGKLDTACRGFLAFLEHAGVLTAGQRELIIERAMALQDEEVSLSKFKIIVLMVLWQQQIAVEALILDELLTDEVEDNDIEDWGDVVPLH